MSNKRLRRLPGGGYTTSATRYLREWGKLARAAEKVLGAKAQQFDPDFVFRTERGESFNLPTSIVKKLAGAKS